MTNQSKVKKTIMLFSCPICEVALRNPKELREHRLHNHKLEFAQSGY